MFVFAGLLVLTGLTLGGCQSMPGRDGDVISQTLSRSAAGSEADGQYEMAARQYRTLLDRQPDNRIARLGLARNLRYSGNAGTAVQVLAEIDAGKSGDLELLLELGKSKIALSRADEAITHLKAAARIAPEDWDIYGAMGIGYDLLQSYDEAWTAYAKALKLSPGNGPVLNNMAFSAALNGNLDRAIKILEDAPLPVRRNPQVRQNLAFFYGIRGDMKKAANLAGMDLDKEAVRNNLAIFSRFRRNRQPANTP
jgi:Flp pilus assembly protein TadD